MSFSALRDTLIALGVVGALLTDPATPQRRSRRGRVVRPSPTIHPPVAREAAALWMAPSAADRTTAAAHPALVHLQAALRLYADEKYDQALAGSLRPRQPTSPLRAHAAYYAGVSELRLRRFEAARRRFAGLKAPQGFVGEAAALGEAEAAQGMGDYGEAVEIYEELLKHEAVDAPAIWLSLATAALADGDRKRAAEAFLHLYYEFPLSEHARQAEGPLQTLAECSDRCGEHALQARARPRRAAVRFAPLPGGARQLPSAEAARAGDDAELVALRLAEIDYFQGRHSQAREALRPYLNERRAAGRGALLLSDGAARLARLRRVRAARARARARDFPDSTWAEEALNNLATYYIQQDRDDEADVVLREMYARFPRGRYAERAAWKAGWTAYRKGDMARRGAVLRVGGHDFPRSDYRPAWLLLVWPRARRDGRSRRARSRDIS